MASLTSADTAGPLERIRPELTLAGLARHYGGGQIEPAPCADDIVANEMQKAAFFLTQERTVQESAADTPGAATSIFKYVEAEYVKSQLELQMRIRGTQGVGWEGPQASAKRSCAWANSGSRPKPISIAGGSNEIQLNIIAKRVLGLPD